MARKPIRHKSGRTLKIVDQRSTSNLGSKFWGRWIFVLEDVNDGSRWEAYGKAATFNSRIFPARTS